jgi:hypothetical protein
MQIAGGLLSGCVVEPLVICSLFDTLIADTSTARANLRKRACNRPAGTVRTLTSTSKLPDLRIDI